MARELQIPSAMKRIAIIALAALGVSAQAQVFPNGPFPTFPVCLEGFDTTAAGTYANMPVFGVPATAQAMGPGLMVVRPFPWVNTAPHLLVGDNADVRITSLIPMRRFGGFFNSGYFGVFSPTATFRFYDVSNNLIGQQTVGLTPAMTWIGFNTIPKWRRVEILGAVPGFQGAVGIDSLRIRPN